MSGTSQNTRQPLTDQNHPVPCQPPPSQFSLARELFSSHEYSVATEQAPGPPGADQRVSLYMTHGLVSSQSSSCTLEANQRLAQPKL